MMSRGQWKDFFVEVKKSMSRYLSILFMVALGVCFFTGLRSSEPDMQQSLDAFMDQTGFLNIRVMGTYGMTENDVTALGAIKGVTDAEGLYTVDVLSDLGESPQVIHVQSLTGEINQLDLSSGRLPESPDECVVDSALADEFDLRLGDRITVYSGTDDDLEDSLGNDTFIITGIGSSPEYLTFDRGSASIGTGSIAGFIAVDKSAFTAPAYTQVYVRADVLDEYNCFSDEYADIVEELTARIEAIAGERCEIRFAEATEEARDKLAEGKQELADAKAEAEKQFEEAKKQIEDGQVKIQEGWDELNASIEQFNAGKQDYEEGLKAFKDGLAQITEGERQLEEAKKLLEEKEAELEAGKAQIEEGWEQYNAGIAELEAAKTQIEESEEQLATLERMFSVAETAYTQAAERWESQKTDLETQQKELDEDKAAYEAENGTSWEDSPLLSLRQSMLDSQAQTIARLEEELAPLKESMEETKATVEDSRRQLEEGKAQYDAGVAELEAVRLQLEASEQQIAEGETAIADGKAEIEANEKELIAGKATLLAGEPQLEAAKTQIEEAEAQIAAGRLELEQGEQELADSVAELEKAEAEAEKEFAKAEEEIADGEKELAKLDMPEWYVLDRNTIQNYVEYDLDAQKIGALGEVVPVIFFFVAALVSLTTMTRMVEEQRTQIGTLKALGYSDISIAMKYILYALSATVAGCVLGVLIGSTLIPWIVMTAYGMLYVNMNVILTPIQPLYSVMASAVAILCTVGAAWLACHRALTSQAAQLMRPVAPTKGKRIFLERIPFIWKHCSFSVKSTLRNLFRYKKRLFMTLFGIGASMGLLIVGFGLQDSLEKIVDRQYTTIWMYDSLMYLNDADDDEAMGALEQYLTDSDEIAGWLDVSSEAMEAEANDVFKSIVLLVPEDAAQIEAFVNLTNRTSGEHFTLDDRTAVISEKLATKLSLEIGDTMTIKIDETERYEVSVGGIVENYMQYYVYMSPEAYEKVFDDEPEWNQRMVLYADGVEENAAVEEKLSAELLEQDAVISVVTSSSTRSNIRNMLKALDYVVILLIVSSGLLAFVVLYNLNNINITERKRELATIKLLGFYPGELAAYVYRENIILTIMGIGIGVLLGTWITSYVIKTVEIDMIMFGRGIDLSSYIIASLMTATFSFIVNVVMYYRLQKIDMIESLKSVE